jgi:hypothetical protein
MIGILGHGERTSWRRAAYASLAAALALAIALEIGRHGNGWWQLAAFGIGPDLALLAGVGDGLARGQLHPRAVRLYNAVHRFPGPVLVLALATAGVGGTGLVVGGLAWALHVALDRAVGYGLRTPDGFQRA